MDVSKKTEVFTKRLEAFKLKMKRLQMANGLTAAKRTLELMRDLIGMHKHEDPSILITHVKEVGQDMIEAKPQELVVANMVRRVLHLIREVAGSEGVVVTTDEDRREFHSVGKTSNPNLCRPVSLLALLDNRTPVAANCAGTEDGAGNPEPLSESTAPVQPQVSAVRDDGSPSRARSSFEHMRKKKLRNWPGKSKVLELLNEAMDELELAEDAIVGSAVEHIHNNEVIMTFGLSDTALKFLKKAALQRQFQVHSTLVLIIREFGAIWKVIVAEAAPKLAGHAMAKQLTDSGVNTLVIPDASIFALMARVNKVLIGAHAVLGTGGVLAQCGCGLVAQAAKFHRVPFIIVTGSRLIQLYRRSNLSPDFIGVDTAGLYKLSPMFPHDPQVMFNSHGCPSDFTGRKLKSATLREDNGQYAEADLFLPCPSVDYIPSENIDLLITDTGGFTPSYVYRLLSEYYSREDYVLCKELLDRMVGH